MVETTGCTIHIRKYTLHKEQWVYGKEGWNALNWRFSPQRILSCTTVTSTSIVTEHLSEIKVPKSIAHKNG